jgi:hypothetical protein
VFPFVRSTNEIPAFVAVAILNGPPDAKLQVPGGEVAEIAMSIVSAVADAEVIATASARTAMAARALKTTLFIKPSVMSPPKETFRISAP